MRAGKQDTVTFVADREAAHLDCLSHTRRNHKLVLADWLMGVEITIHKSRNCVSKTMRAGETVTVSQGMTVDAELHRIRFDVTVIARAGGLHSWSCALLLPCASKSMSR